MLETSENGAVAVDAMVSMASRALGDGVPSNELQHRLNDVVFAAPEDSEDQADRFASWIQSLGFSLASTGVDAFVGIARTLASHFLLVVEFPDDLVDTRSVIKYEYEEPVSRQSRLPQLAVGLDWSVPQFGMAASWHMELEALPGVRIAELVVQESEPDGAALEEWEDAPDLDVVTSAAHVTCRPSHRLTTAVAIAELRPVWTGMVTAALTGVVLTTAIVVAVLVEYWFPGKLVTRGEHLPAASVSIVLVGPALLLSWLARAPEHALLAAVLSASRAVVSATAANLTLIAATDVIPLRAGVLHTVWVLIVGLQIACVCGMVAVLRSVRPSAYGQDTKNER